MIGLILNILLLIRQYLRLAEQSVFFRISSFITMFVLLGALVLVSVPVLIVWLFFCSVENVVTSLLFKKEVKQLLKFECYDKGSI